MINEIDIRRYKNHFHDGSLLDISKIKKDVMFLMSSAEVDPLEIDKSLILSKDYRIRGVLHLHNIQNMYLTGEYKLEDLFSVFNFGTILDFEIINNTFELGVLWENHPPKIYTNEFTTIIIKFDRIQWENIPDLTHPFLVD